MSLRSRIPCIAVLLVLGSVASPCLAQQTSAPPSPAAQLREGAADRAGQQSMLGELRQNAERTRATVTALESRYAATSDAGLQALIQRHIEAAKRDGALENFRIQLRHAQAQGRAAVASELQAVIEERTRRSVIALPALPAIPSAPVPTRTASVKRGGAR